MRALPIIRARWASFAALLAISALLLGACASSEPAAEPDTEDEQTQTEPAAAQTNDAGDDGTEGEDADDEEPTEVIDVKWGGASGPSQAGLRDAVIKDRGLDEKHGLNLDITALAPDQSELAVLTGQVDVGFLPLISWANAVAEGEDLVVLDLTSHNHGALLVPEDSDYQTVEDLIGKKIATLNPVSSMYTSTQVILSQMGLDWPEQFEVISGPPPALTSFIESGEVDAIVHFEPNVCRLISTGNYRIIWGLDEQWQELTGDSLPLTGFVARRDWLEENPDVAERIRDMGRDLGETISGNPEIIAEYAELLGLETEEEINCASERMAPQYEPFSEEESLETAGLFLDSAVEEGIIEAYPDQIFVWEK